MISDNSKKEDSWSFEERYWKSKRGTKESGPARQGKLTSQAGFSNG